MAVPGLDIRVTDSLTDWEPHTIALRDFLAIQAAAWGRPDFNACEYLQHDTIVRVYLDRDLYLPHPPQPPELRHQRQLCLDSLRAIFGGDPTFDPRLHVRFAHRHGYVPAKASHKVSFRCYVPRYSIRMGDIPTLLAYFDQAGFWDPAPYSRRQKLAVPGGCKGQGGDRRTLQLEEGVRPEDCIAQAVDGTEIRLEDFAEAQADVARKAGRKVGGGEQPESWAEIVPRLVQAGFVDPHPIGRREQSITFQSMGNLGRPCPCGCGSTHDRQNWWVSASSDGELKVKSYSTRCKLMTLMAPIPVMDITPITPQMPQSQQLDICLNNMGFPDVSDPIPGKCFTLQQHLATCPICSGCHTSSCYLISALVQHCFTVKNTDLGCKGRILDVKTMVQDHAILKRIIRNPSADSPLAELYVQERGQDLTAVDDKVYRFADNKWKVVEDVVLEKDVYVLLNTVLEGLVTFLTNEELATRHNRDGISIKELRKLRDTLDVAVGVNGNHQKRKQILCSVKMCLNDSSLRLKWDGEAYTLGTDDGLIDLRTGTFRQARKEDYVTMTTGYDYDVDADDVIREELDVFLRQCYPIEDERNFMMKYSGYCLLGRHEAKLMVMLTDKRGGWNAKSTFLSLLRGTMGEYAIKADAGVLYRQERTRGMNDHSSGLLAFEKKRLMVVEETDSSKMIDEEKIKDWCGNRTRVSGRQLHSAEMREFEWITKIIVAANEGKIPFFNCSDDALVSRLATVPHRSRFMDPPLTDAPYTFPVDGGIKQKFLSWYPYMLRWCVRGLLAYHEEGFRIMPEGCLAFKKQILDDKDVVKEWLDDTLEEGENREYVRVCDLYHRFCNDNRSFQADKKTKKSAKGFERELHRCLNTDRFKERHQLRVQGKNVTAGKVFLNYKFIDHIAC